MTRPDVEADIAAYAARQRAERRRTVEREARYEANRRYRGRHKTPTPVTYTPPTPRPAFVDWRTRLDQRISRCPGCDDWQFDQRCNRCQPARTEAA